MKPSKVNAGGSGGKIHVIGIAPGRFTPEDEFLLRFISEADLLIGRREYLARWPGIPSIELGKDLGKALELAEMNRAAGKLVVFLASGDPLFFGIGGTLCKRLGPDKVRVHPSISSMQLAFSRIGESWDDARFLSAHSRPLEEVVRGVAACDKACVLTSGSTQPNQLARALLGLGLGDWEVFLCENLGFEDERISKMGLEELAKANCSPLNLLIFKRVRGADKKRESADILLGLEDEEFLRLPGREGMITKRELRAVVLSRLQLKPGDVLWDVGAGSGAISVEASRMMIWGEVYAVERDAAFVDLLRKNVARLAHPNVHVVEGEAPGALEGLPEPDAVFLGGTGGRLREILSLCCKRIRPGGRLVANFVSPARAVMAMEILEKTGMDTELFLFQGARLKETTGGELLSAHNPVLVISACKE